MKLSILPTLLLVALSSCAATSIGTDAPQTTAPAPAEKSAEKSAEDKAKEAQALQDEIANLQHKVRVAQIKTDMAKLAVDGDDVDLQQKRQRAQLALASARSNLEYFNSVDAPNRTGRAELSLQSTEDRAKEAQEELEQIAIMYDDQNLETMTAEFVIQRGKRRAERANKSIEFSKLDLRGLIHHKLKQERQGLEDAVLKAEQNLESLDRDAKKNQLNRTLKISEANHALKSAEDALKKAQDKAAKGAGA